MLAIFVGFEVITKVPPTLHTPADVGLQRDLGHHPGRRAAGHRLPNSSTGQPSSAWLAVVFATINVVGGFLVTHRMLAMFRRKD